jgi:predicted aspartyl protease
MRFAFDPHQGLIVIDANVIGPSGSALVRLAVDTGAVGTVIAAGLLVAVGYDPALAPDRVQITTASGVEFVPRVTLAKITALGLDRQGFPVLCHTLPSSVGVDGLLGLDFLRGQLLTVDFRLGQVALT